MLLDQIIYTRCSPVFDLDKKKFIQADQFGIYSLSEGLLEASLKELNRIIEPMESRYEEQDSRVFWFCYESGGRNVVMRSVMREHDPNKRRNNGKDHKPGIMIAQALVGRFDFPSCELLGSALFDCDKIDASEAYRMDYPNWKAEFLPQVEFTSASWRGASAQDGNGTGISEDGGLFLPMLKFALSGNLGKKFLLAKEDSERFIEDISQVIRLFPLGLANRIHYASAASGCRDLGVLFPDKNGGPVFDIIRVCPNDYQDITSRMRRSIFWSRAIACEPQSAGEVNPVSERNYVKAAVSGEETIWDFRQWLTDKISGGHLGAIGFEDICGLYDFYIHVCRETEIPDYDILLNILKDRDRLFADDEEDFAKADDVLFAQYAGFAQADEDGGWIVLKRLADEDSWLERLIGAGKDDRDFFARLVSFFKENPADESLLARMDEWAGTLWEGEKPQPLVELKIMLFALRLHSHDEAQIILRTLENCALFFIGVSITDDDVSRMFDEETIGKAERLGRDDAAMDRALLSAFGAFRENGVFQKAFECFFMAARQRKGWLERMIQAFSRIENEDPQLRDGFIKMTEEILENLIESAAREQTGAAENAPIAKKKKGLLGSLFGK